MVPSQNGLFNETSAADKGRGTLARKIRKGRRRVPPVFIEPSGPLNSKRSVFLTVIFYNCQEALGQTSLDGMSIKEDTA